MHLSVGSLGHARDRAGYLRRECPACARLFKWSSAPTAVRRDADRVCFCPYCGTAAPTDQWDTIEQRCANRPGRAEWAEEQLRGLVGESTGSSMVLYHVNGEQFLPPDPVEPDDMAEVVPPCHADNPFRAAEDWTGLLRCISCGQAFAMGRTEP